MLVRGLNLILIVFWVFGFFILVNWILKLCGLMVVVRELRVVEFIKV